MKIICLFHKKTDKYSKVVPYISLSSSIGYNEGNGLPEYLLVIHKKIPLEISQ